MGNVEKASLANAPVEWLGKACGGGTLQILRQGCDGFRGYGLRVVIVAVECLPQFDNPGDIESVGEQWVTCGHGTYSLQNRARERQNVSVTPREQAM